MNAENKHQGRRDQKPHGIPHGTMLEDMTHGSIVSVVTKRHKLDDIDVVHMKKLGRPETATRRAAASQRPSGNPPPPSPNAHADGQRP